MAVEKHRRQRSRTPRVSEHSNEEYGTRLLLDTHVWLWWQTASKRLSPRARHAIGGAPEVFVSAASAWEISIKAALGKIIIPATSSIADELARDGFRALPIGVDHAERVRTLPLHHRDPFDRILIAQCEIERLTIITVDPVFAKYAIGVFRADTGVSSVPGNASK